MKKLKSGVYYFYNKEVEKALIAKYNEDQFIELSLNDILDYYFNIVIINVRKDGIIEINGNGEYQKVVLDDLMKTGMYNKFLYYIGEF